MQRQFGLSESFWPIQKDINPHNILNITIMEELVKKINELAAAFDADATAQAVKGNKAAGLRARKEALELINLLKEFRKESTAKAKA